MTSQKIARSNLYSRAFLFFTLALTVNVSFADEPSTENPLIGKWTISFVNNCKRPSYEFTPTQIINKTDADGKLVIFRYSNPEYVIGKDIVKVDFKKPHGIGGTVSDNSLSFKFTALDFSEIIRKNGKNIKLLKCPVKKFRKEEK